LCPLSSPIETFTNPVSYICRALLSASCTSFAVSDTGPMARPRVSLVTVYGISRYANLFRIASPLAHHQHVEHAKELHVNRSPAAAPHPIIALPITKTAAIEISACVAMSTMSI